MTKPSICECCQQVVPSPPPGTEHIRPNLENFVCRRCGCSEVECLDWVRVNDNVLQVDVAMACLDFICDNAPVIERLVNQCLIQEELQRNPDAAADVRRPAA